MGFFQLGFVVYIALCVTTPLMALEEVSSKELKHLFSSKDFSSEPAPILTYDLVKKIVKDNELRTIEELLPLLPEKYRKFYTLVYESKSLHGATPEKPRIILYGPDAKLLMGMAGDTESRNGDTLEMIEWKAKESQFAFYRIHLPEAEDRRKEVWYEVNPPQCYTCHRKEIRPNWDAYRSWRGVYGSRSENQFDEITLGSKEDKNYSQFLLNSSDKYRYAHLPKITKFTERSKDKKKLYESLGVGNFSNGAVIHPNGFFTLQLGELNLRRIAGLIKRHANYGKFKYALGFLTLCRRHIPPHTQVAVLDGAGKVVYKPAENIPVENLVTPVLQQKGMDLSTLSEEYLDLVNFEFLKRTGPVATENPVKEGEPENPARFAEFHKDEFNPGRLPHRLAWLYLLERMELNTDDLGMSFNYGTHALGTGAAPPLHRMGEIMVRQDGELAAFLTNKDKYPWEAKDSYQTTETTVKNCHALVQKSLKALQ